MGVSNLITINQLRAVHHVIQGEVCACGTRKQSKTAFCYRCFNMLPREIKQQLWGKFGSFGFYAEAYEAALAWLKTNTKRILE